MATEVSHRGSAGGEVAQRAARHVRRASLIATMGLRQRRAALTASIPMTIWLDVARRMDLVTLHRFGLMCKWSRDVSRDDDCWRRRYRERFGVPSAYSDRKNYEGTRCCFEWWNRHSKMERNWLKFLESLARTAIPPAERDVRHLRWHLMRTNVAFAWRIMRRAADHFNAEHCADRWKSRKQWTERLVGMLALGCQRADEQVVRFVLDVGKRYDLDVLRCETRGRASFNARHPGCMAIVCDSAECLRLLLDAGMHVDGMAWYDSQKLPFAFMAARLARPNCLRLLVERGASNRFLSRTLLLEGCSGPWSEKRRQVVYLAWENSKTDIDEPGESAPDFIDLKVGLPPLHRALKDNNLALADYLYDTLGANPLTTSLALRGTPYHQMVVRKLQRVAAQKACPQGGKRHLLAVLVWLRERAGVTQYQQAERRVASELCIEPAEADDMDELFK